MLKDNDFPQVLPPAGGQAAPWRLRQSTMLLTASIALALASPGSLMAQDQDQEEMDSIMEEVIVTATRREESLQEVPLAVTAFTEQQLRELQVNNLDSLQGAVPNMNLVQGRGSNSSVNAFIRGVGQPDALQSFDPAVGIYLDDVYISRIQGALFKLYDIERIEVLRGPQGTLYGKNTPGGAIKIVTRTPGDTTEVRASVLFGNYSRVAAQAYLSIPFSDDFALSLSALKDTRDGFVIDPLTGIDYNDDDTTVARMKANWDITDNFNAQFSFDWTDEDVELTLGNSEVPLISVDLVTGPVVRYVPPPGEWQFNSSTSLTDAGGQSLTHKGMNLTLNWDISDAVTLKSITGYRELETASFIDIDATTLQLGDVFVGLDQDQFSQEFQLLGDNGGDLTWVTGLFYLKENVPSQQAAFADDFLLFNGLPVSFLRTIDDDLETTSYAAFGQLDWAFADRWSLGLGIRYTYEEKDYFRTTSTFSDLLGNADPAFAFSDSADWSDWNPTITLDYAASDNVNFYGRLANGFKSGGFNGRANTPADVSTFDPETVWTAEIGAKTLVADGRLQANYTLFYSQYEDFQARVSETTPGPGGVPDFRFPVLNAAELDLWGAEVELAWFPIDPLQLTAQVGYLNSEYGAGGFSGADGVPDEPAFSPEWTARFAGIYTVNFTDGSALQFGADASFRDFMHLSVENTPALTQDDYWVFNAFASLVSSDDRWRLNAGILNAADELYRVDGQEFRSVGNIQTAYYGDPRTYTIELVYHYF